MGPELKMGSAVNILKRTAMSYGVDTLVHENALISYQGGLITMPRIFVPPAGLAAAMEGHFKLVEAGVDQLLDILQDDMMDKSTVVKSLLAQLALVPHITGGVAVALVPVTDVVVNKKLDSWDKVDDEDQKGKTPFERMLLDEAGLKRINTRSAFVGFRTQAMMGNRLVAEAAFDALATLAKDWIDDEVQSVLKARDGKFRKRIGSDPLGVLIGKKEAKYLHARQLLNYYMRQYIIANQTLYGPCRAVKSIESDELLTAGLIVKMDQIMAINAMKDLIPIVKESLGDAVTFTQGDVVDPLMIDKIRYLVDAIQLLLPLLVKNYTPGPYGKKIFTKSAADYWTLTVRPKYFRNFYFMGHDYLHPENGDKKESQLALKPFKEDGLIAAHDVIVKATGVKTEEDPWSILNEQIRNSATLEINGDQLEMIYMLGTVDKRTPWDEVWTTESPQTIARLMDIPLWEVFPGISDAEYEQYHEYLTSAIIASSRRWIAAYESSAPFEGMPYVITLTQSVCGPVVMTDIPGIYTITPHDLDGLNGEPIIPKRWADDLRITYGKAIEEFAVSWAMLG